MKPQKKDTPKGVKLTYLTVKKTAFGWHLITKKRKNKSSIFVIRRVYNCPLTGFKKSLDFALSLYPNNLETFCLSVLPGTVLHDEAEKLHLTFQNDPPYHVIHTDKYSKTDLQESEKLSAACNIFYNLGRAVPWFNSVCYFFHEKPSAFLINFVKMYEKLYKSTDLSIRLYENFDENSILNAPFGKKCDNSLTCDCESEFSRIQKLQLTFLKNKCDEKNLSKAYKVIESIVLLHGAFSENEATGRTQVVSLSYHPDDLLSDYATDIAFFVKNAKVCKCKVKVEKGGYKVVKG